MSKRWCATTSSRRNPAIPHAIPSLALFSDRKYIRQRTQMKRLGLINDDEFAKEWIDFEEKIIGTPLIGYIEDRDSPPTRMISHSANVQAQMSSVFGIIRRYISKKQKEAGIIPGITGNTTQQQQQVLTNKQKAEQQTEATPRDMQPNADIAQTRPRKSDLPTQ